MSVYGDNIVKTFKAAVDLDLSTSQYVPVYITDVNMVDIVTTNTQKAIGILQNRPSKGTGAACDVALLGLSKAKGYNTFTAGDLICAGSNGVVKASGLTLGNTGTSVSLWTVGEAIDSMLDDQTAGIFQILVKPQLFISSAVFTTTLHTAAAVTIP